MGNISAEIEIQYKPSEENDKESNENIDFAIDTPPHCLTITLNSKNCDGDDHLLYTNFEEQLQKKRNSKMSPSKARKYKNGY